MPDGAYRLNPPTHHTSLPSPLPWPPLLHVYYSSKYLIEKFGARRNIVAGNNITNALSSSCYIQQTQTQTQRLGCSATRTFLVPKRSSSHVLFTSPLTLGFSSYESSFNGFWTVSSEALTCNHTSSCSKSAT